MFSVVAFGQDSHIIWFNGLNGRSYPTAIGGDGQFLSIHNHDQTRKLKFNSWLVPSRPARGMGA
jgi:hypothetical protein